MPDNAQAPQGGTGLAPNVAGALSYFLMPITGIVFLVAEKENAFVRFHAAQATLVGIALIVVWFVFVTLATPLLVIPFLGWLLFWALWIVARLGTLVAWLGLMFMAFQGKEFEVPWIGAQARKLVHQVAL